MQHQTDVCRSCGNPEDGHNYRHPFRVKLSEEADLQANIAELKARRADLKRKVEEAAEPQPEKKARTEEEEKEEDRKYHSITDFIREFNARAHQRAAEEELDLIAQVRAYRVALQADFARLAAEKKK